MHIFPSKSTNLSHEALIRQRLQSGTYQNVDDVLLQALKFSEPKTKSAEPNHQTPAHKANNLVELFTPLRGLELDFSRNDSTGRPVDL